MMFIQTRNQVTKQKKIYKKQRLVLYLTRFRYLRLERLRIKNVHLIV